jgi:hypothetical protein
MLPLTSRWFHSGIRACAVFAVLLACAGLLAVVASIVYYISNAEEEVEYQPPEPHPRQSGSSRRVITRWSPAYPPDEPKADLNKWYDAIDDVGERDSEQPAFVARVFLSHALSHRADGDVSRKAYTEGYRVTQYFKTGQSIRALVYFGSESQDHVLLKLDPETARWDVEEAWVNGSPLPIPEPKG